MQILQEQNVDYVIVEYLKNPLNKIELQSLSVKLGMKPSEFIRKGESEFKEQKLQLHLGNDNLLFDKMENYPKLMERPIIVNGDKAVIGRPPENLLEII